MTPYDLNARQRDRMRASGSPDVKWIRTSTPSLLPSPMSEAAAQERTEQTNALIVIALTLACTALSLYDLVLLASGS
jgi:hypothetical protein